MGKRLIVVDSWIAGASHDPKDGLTHGFKRSQSVDVRRRSSSIRLHRSTVKESGSTVTTPVTDIVRVPNGRLFMMGDSKVYQRNKESAGGLGSYSTLSTTGVASGMKFGVYNLDKDAVYIPAGGTISRIDTPQGTPSFNANLITQIKDKEVINTGSNTYTVPTTAPGSNESATHQLKWIPDVEPMIKIGVYVVAKGTTDLYFEVHDAQNTVIASGTILNGSLTNGALNLLTISQTRLYVGSSNQTGRTYHLHLRGTGTTTTPTTVRVATASDLSTGDITTYAAPLVSGVDHPAYQFLQYLLFGNERYVAAYEPITDAPLKTEYKAHRLSLPADFKVLAFAELNENCVISCYKSVASDYGGDFGVNSTEGYLLFWDGAQARPNWIKKVSGGAFESPFEKDGVLYGYVNGILHATTGDVPVPVFTLPGVDNFASSNGHDDDVYLQAPVKGMAVDRGVLMMGFPMLSSNDNITPGVYGYGTRNKDYPESFSLDYIPSHGDTTIGYDGSTPKVPLSGITYIGKFGANIFVAWQRGSGGTQSFGVDVIRRNNQVFATGNLDHLDFDLSLPHKDKQAIEVGIIYKTLPTGTSVTPRYRLEDESSYEYGTADQLQSDPTRNLVRLTIDKLYRKIEFGMELTGNANGSPEVLAMYFLFDDLAEEGQ